VTTVCDHFSAIRKLREGSLDSVGLRMNVSHGDQNRRMPSDSSQGVRIGTHSRKVRQSRMAKAVRLERLQIRAFVGRLCVGFRQNRQCL
jgi:hypothetical protein